jgi:hypothetical protein
VPPITNPTPEVVLATFNSIGTRTIPSDQIESSLLRNLVARAVTLAGNILTQDDQLELDEIRQELAMRLLGREPTQK